MKLNFKTNDGDVTFDIKKVITETISNRKALNEALTKDDVKQVEKIFRAEFKDSMKDIEKQVKDIVSAELKGKENEDVIVEICRNIIVQLFKTLWVRRNAFAGSLKNKKG